MPDLVTVPFTRYLHDAGGEDDISLGIDMAALISLVKF